MKSLKLILLALALSFAPLTVNAMMGTLDDYANQYGSPMRHYLEHLRIGRNDFGVCDVYVFATVIQAADDGRVFSGDIHYVYVLRHDVGVLRVGTVCDELTLRK